MNKKSGDLTAQLYVLSPLINFTSDFEELRLSDDLVICLPTAEEKRIIEDASSSSPLSHMRFLRDWQFVIRSVANLQISEEQITADNLDFQSGPYRCCSALRLLKEGTIGLGYQYLMAYPPLQLVTRLGRDTLYYDKWGEYFFKNDEVPEFKDLYDVINQLDHSKYKKIKIALLRFDFSYNVGLLYQLIDLMIAFEALYIADEKELGYKMASRASFLLAEDVKQRNQIFNMIKKAYSLRGKLVHGSDLPNKIEISKGKYLSSLEFTTQVRGLLRDSIKRFIELLNYHSHKQLLETVLDSNIMAEGSLLK